MKTTYALRLDDKMTAQITLTGAGQQPPDEGNLVTVQCKLALPDEGDCNYLAKALRFERITINAPLDAWWGHTGDGCRYVTKNFHAKTWHAARAQAAAWARGAIKPLRGALAERAKALEDAGDWE